MNATQIEKLRLLLQIQGRSAPGAKHLDGNPPMVLFGAGGRGRRILNGLGQLGVVPVAFADNQSAHWGTHVQGVPVLAPNDAAKRFPDAVFVTTIWSDRIGHPLAAVRTQLADLGVQRVASFTALYQKYPDLFFPDFFLDRLEKKRDQESAILDAARLWEDPRSADEFLAQLALRITLDFEHVAHATCNYPPYFPPDLFDVSESEVFVDCGAYDGDNYNDYLRLTAGRFGRYIAFEPDVENFRKLTARVNSQTPTPDSNRVRLLPYGLSQCRETIRFSSNGSTESRVNPDGTLEIQCISLDEVLAAESPTYIKMDIEGAEANALRGARQTLARHRPILAVSAYHRMTDLWQLPLLIASLTKEYAFYLRPEKQAGWDLICYAMPRERLKGLP